MKSKPFYISTPIRTSHEDRCAVRNTLDELVGHEDKYEFSSSMWEPRSKYSRKDLENALAIIIVLPDIEWKTNKLTRGVASELQFCIDHPKPVFLAYRKRSTGEIKFYKIVYFPEKGTLQGSQFSSTDAEGKIKKIYQEYQFSSTCETFLAATADQVIQDLNLEVLKDHANRLEKAVNEREAEQESWFW